MGPVRGNIKRKREVEKRDEKINLTSGFSEECSAEYWVDLSRKIAGNPSSSKVLDQYKSNFQMSKKTFDYICSLAKDHMIAKTHFTFINGKPMSLSDQVALALRRLGSGNSLISVGESFGTHHSIVSQVTWRFVEAIEQNGFHHIQWPSTEKEMTDIKQKFEKIRGLPNCCGAIDTTHIKMLLTSSDREADSWLDRKKNHSMIVQAIVDPDLRFRDVVIGWPGKLTDSSVLQSSNFYKLCQARERLNREMELREYIIGDSGFPLLPWLMTSYKGKEISENEREFNMRLIATHNVAQKALVRLKDGWRMIQGEMWRPDKHRLPRVILVCCILHNIVIDMEDENMFEFTATKSDHDPGYRPEVCKFVDNAGLILRDRLSLCFSGKKLKTDL